MKFYFTFLLSFCFLFASAQTTTLLSEDFSSGIPSSWYLGNLGSCTDGFVLENDPVMYWNAVANGPLDTSITGNFMVAESYTQQSGSCQAYAEIFTPTFDGTTCDSVFFNWAMDFNPFGSPDDSVQLIVWNGQDNVLWTIDNNFGPIGGAYYEEISSYITNQNTQVGFIYYGNFGGWLALDNIDIECYVAPLPASWDCVNNICTDPGTGAGSYSDSLVCATACAPVTAETWDCVGGACVDPGTGVGSYMDSLVCVASCGVTPTTSWECIAGTACVDLGAGNGTYTDSLTCVASCGVCL